jgi:hypothetical protein
MVRAQVGESLRGKSGHLIRVAQIARHGLRYCTVAAGEFHFLFGHTYFIDQKSQVLLGEPSVLEELLA